MPFDHWTSNEKRKIFISKLKKKCVYLSYDTKSLFIQYLFWKKLTLATPMYSFIYSTPRCLDIVVCKHVGTTMDFILLYDAPFSFFLSRMSSFFFFFQLRLSANRKNSVFIITAMKLLRITNNLFEELWSYIQTLSRFDLIILVLSKHFISCSKIENR